MRIFNIFKRSRGNSEPINIIVGGVGGADMPLRFGAGLNPMHIAAAHRCITLISNAVASMPLSYQKHRGGVFTDCSDDALYTAFRFSPNPQTTAFEFFRTLTRRMLLDGVVYIVTDAAGYYYIENALSVTADHRRGTYTVNDSVHPFLSGIYAEEEIIVIRHLTGDGLNYESISDAMRETLTLAAEGDNEAYTRMVSGGQPYMLFKDSRGILGTGTRIEDSRKELMSRLQDSTRQGQRYVWLPPSVEAQVVGASAADMQFQSMREFVVRDICRFFGVPPTLVFSDGNSSYKTPEAANIDFLVNCLNPILCNIETSMQMKLIKPTQWASRRFRFDRRNRLVADQQSQAHYMQTLMGLGLTPNEIRSRLDMETVEGGDAPLVSANLRPLDQINQPSHNNETD